MKVCKKVHTRGFMVNFHFLISDFFIKKKIIMEYYLSFLIKTCRTKDIRLNIGVLLFFNLKVSNNLWCLSEIPN